MRAGRAVADDDRIRADRIRASGGSHRIVDRVALPLAPIALS
ncbi:hypothetical protein VC273_01110 [Xanthomonas nasturtii]|nr:hypothetical protein [Xanthomonas nasturtii]MEA9554571.1 hypothetical protein [Xanthomonas nasturtii]